MSHLDLPAAVRGAYTGGNWSRFGAGSHLSTLMFAKWTGHPGLSPKTLHFKPDSETHKWSALVLFFFCPLPSAVVEVVTRISQAESLVQTPPERKSVVEDHESG